MKSNEQLIFKTFESLQAHLRNCVQWNSLELGSYDIIGLTTLLSSLLENIGEKAHEEDFEEIRSILSKSNLEFLKKLLSN